ncbi:MAG: D-alanyl-D-alanine carboxypeptidase/D-alanyl-D-alanine-endopeptidase [Prevotella sp.]|nr:D-alanyl-D-alanine carboxypeptidase/D-alanyl-D-alanine-endopeptidase [Prevotella sp.]
MTSKAILHISLSILMLFSALCAEPLYGRQFITDDDTTPGDSVTAPLDSVQGGLDTIPALPWPQSLQAALDTIVSKSSLLKTSQMGLYIYDLTADSAIYSRDSKQTLRPASTMKLITAITALDKLGGAYLYKTRLCYSGDVIDSLRTLNGNIYLIGGMDPMIGTDDIRAFISSIKELGVDTIRGNICADRSMKDTDLYGEGWCWDDDNPELSALVYHRKDALMQKFFNMLGDNGVVVIGSLDERRCPNGAFEICCQTHSIDQILNRMMKDSNNLFAESLFYQIGLTRGRPSTAKKAVAAEEEILKKMKMQDVPHRFADGSGLSLYNYVSAELEVAFLRYAYEDANIYTDLFSHLPIAGVDGTLEKRMRGTSAANNVRAKTGTLSGVSGLSGYCTAPNGHILAFAIINQGQQNNARAKALQDRICTVMCQ